MKIDFANKKMSYSKIKKNLFPEISKADFDKIYQNQSYIGSGMQGQVYKATMGNQLVAIKYFRKQFIGVEYINYIQSEIQTLRDMNHPNIVGLIDSYQVRLGSHYSQRKYCIVCEYCRQSLSNYYVIQNLTDLQKLNMCLELTSAIKAAHQQKIIHRDIKPENILIKDLQTYTIKLADFGCCRIQSGDQNLSMTKNVGTPLYADPKISSGKYSNKCDVYSVGLVMVYIFCGKHYFSHCDTRERLIDAKRKFCMNIESEAREFLKRYELNFQIQQFLINIATFTLSDNEAQRLNSDALYTFVKREVESYKLMQLHQTEVQHDPQPPVAQKFFKSRTSDFQEQPQPKMFSKPKKPQQETKPIVIEEPKSIVDSPQKNEEIQKINLDNQSSVSKSNRSDLSDSKSRKTTDRLTDKRLSPKSNNEGKSPISAFETQSYNSSANEDLNTSNGDIHHENTTKVEQKVNQTLFSKKTTSIKEEEGNPGSKQKISKNISKPPIQKSNSSILQSKRRSFEKKQNSNERKKRFELSYKQLSAQEQLCGEMIKYLAESTVIKDQCKAMDSVLRKFNGVRSCFQLIKSIQQVQTYSMTFQQKQVVAFLFHSLYLFELKDFRNFLYGGTSKLHTNFGRLNEQDKQLIFQMINKEVQRIWPNMKKYSNDLIKKSGLIKPKISTTIGNLIKDVMMCADSSSLLDLNLSQNQLLYEGNNFINEKLRQVKYNDDKKIIEKIKVGLAEMAM